MEQICFKETNFKVDVEITIAMLSSLLAMQIVNGVTS